MGGPWEDYASADGPWNDYKSTAAPAVPEPGGSFFSRAANKTSNFLRNVFGGAFGPKAIEVATSITKPLEAGAEIIRDNPEGALEALPAIMATGAGLATGGAGAIPAIMAAGGAGAVGRAITQEGREAMGLPGVNPEQPKVPFTNINIPDVPGIPQKASRVLIEGALQAGPEAIGRGMGAMFKAGGKMAEEGGINAARRSQGFQKSQLSSSKSWSESLRKQAKANEAAKTSLERGDIPLSGSPETMMENSLKQLQEGSRKVKSALEAVRSSGKTLSQEEVDTAILKALDPKNEDELAAALKIERALKDSSEGGKTSVDALNDLRQSFGQIGFRDKTVGTSAADMYRAAWKAAGDQLKKLLGDVDPKYARLYMEGLKTEEMANTSLSAITNRMAGERGNALLSIPAFGTEVMKRGLAPAGVVLFKGGKAAKDIAAPVGVFSSILARYREKAKISDQKKKAPPSPVKRDSILTPAAVSAEARESTPKLTKDRGLYNDGLEFFLSGDKAKAKESWQKAYKMNRKNTQAQRGLERLAQQDGKDIDAYIPK